MALKYWPGSHTRHRLMYHLVWIPKYRKRILQGKVAVRLRQWFYEAAKVNWWWIEEMKILPDHVHLLIQIHPTETVAEVVQKLKGGTSYRLRQEFAMLPNPRNEAIQPVPIDPRTLFDSVDSSRGL